MNGATEHGRFEAALDELRRERDELRVRLHLGKADLRDEWDRLERRFEDARGRVDVLKREAGKTAGEVGAALRLVVEELRAGYARLRKAL